MTATVTPRAAAGDRSADAAPGCAAGGSPGSHPARRPRPGRCSRPGTIWMLAFFLVPVIVMCAYSVMPRGEYGGVDPGFTLEAYTRFLHPVYLTILERTLVLAVATTVLSRARGLSGGLHDRPQRALEVAAALSRGPAVLDELPGAHVRHDLPDARHGIDQQLADRQPGCRQEPITMLYTPFAVLAGLVYGYLPFMVLPIYASLEKLDPALLEAAEVLGARPAARFRRVTLPLVGARADRRLPPRLHPVTRLVPDARTSSAAPRSC